ncbi:MAG TPA: hypothetical protein VG099_24855, partial [Gemmataceae bacterium]|nr:hypothetical protein [Gemmataceae bacterium]
MDLKKRLVLAKVKAIAEDLGIQKDGTFLEKMRTLESNPPEWIQLHSKPLSCQVEKGVDLFIEVKPKVGQKEKWYLSCGFYVSRFF